jgi:hypothetical protein
MINSLGNFYRGQNGKWYAGESMDVFIHNGQAMQYPPGFCLDDSKDQEDKNLAKQFEEYATELLVRKKRSGA